MCIRDRGFNIVLDIYSGSVHLVDDVTYDIIEKYKNTDKNLLKDEIKEKYQLTDNELDAAFNEVEELISTGQLFTEDNFKDLAIDVTKRPTTVSYTHLQQH